MRSWSLPTGEDVERLVALASRPENRAYFFDRLENPKWVPALAEKGFFTEPPEPMPADQPGYVRFPPWPEGQYLARVAEEAPDAVASVLEQVPTSGNPTVIRHQLEAAWGLPDEHVRRLASKILGWLAAPFPEHFADEGAALAVRLLKAGDAARGLAAVEALLEVQPDPRASDKAATDSLVRLLPEPTGRVSDWHYERIIEKVRQAVEAHVGIVGVRVFSKLLDQALRHSAWEHDPPADQASHVWRPAIEEHEQNTHRDIRNLLVSALRDIALTVAEPSEEDLEAVIGELEGRSLVHGRIALHVLATSSSRNDLASERINDPRLRENHRVRHEFATLLRRRFGDADDEVKQRLISWIEDGPDLEKFRETHERGTGQPPSEDEVERYAQSWRRDWYSFIVEQAGESASKRYEELVAAVGPPEHPDFLSWSESERVGPQSPTSVDQLLEWPPERVIHYLHTWVPDDDSGWPFGPSIEGLARDFSVVAKQRAADFAPVADRLADLDPRYVRGFFSGLEDRIREGGEIHWEQPLALAAAVVAGPYEPEVEATGGEREPGWRWCRQAVASLLRTGLTKDGGQIPFTFRANAWEVIGPLTHDPDPSPEHERRYGGEKMDPHTLSLNTNRGIAMHAVVEYGLWCRRQLESTGADETRGFESTPEVRAVLERHLDPDVEPSFAIRAVYGRWLPWLLLQDEVWTVAHLAEIFPDAPGHVSLRDTAWATYLAWCPPYDSAYRALCPLYEAAVQRVPCELKAGTLWHESVDAKLGEHLVVFYWRDVADQSILEEFFARASDELAGDVMEFVGRSLRNTQGEVPPLILERIRSLWDRRLDVIAQGPTTHREEARAFGISFSSGKLDDDWALPSLETAIAACGSPRIPNLVVERLAAIAAERPVECARSLSMMLTYADNDCDFLAWRNEAGAIIEAARGSGAPEAADHCAAVVDFYVRRGQFEFRELAPTTPGE